ncbi:MAG: group 1 glycosyl transferase [Verrucomicrobiales bacterium]|nr:group 1 glycosyl transferase [Verrucomicrobiales bacterium]
MTGETKACAPVRKVKRVLMTAATVGGVWTYALELVQALHEHGIEVALATMGAVLNREQRKEARDLSNLEVFESRYKLEWMEEPWDDVDRAAEWLLDLEQRTQPDLIHLNNFAHGGLPWKAPVIVVGHSCVLSWWKAVKHEGAPASWNVYARKVREGLQAADLVVAPTRAMLLELKRYYGTFAAQKVIHNSRNPSHFHTRTKEEIIFTAGRLWDEGENIAALAKIGAEIPWTIYLAGPDKDPSGRPNEIGKSVCCLGRLPSELLAKWFSRASIYVAPALYEPFGLSILEAALSGCALVLSDIPSLREVWNGAALFVSPDDPAELKTALLRLIENPFRRKELSAYAQCRAIQFNPQHMAAEYLAAYTQVLAHPRPREKRGSFANPNVLPNAVV